MATDSAAEREILRELRDNAVARCMGEELLMIIGLGERYKLAEARLVMFEAKARYQWAGGNFGAAHRATEFAVFVADDQIKQLDALLARFELVVLPNTRFVAQKERARAEIVLLRFRAEAAKRSIELAPAMREMMEATLKNWREKTIFKSPPK